MGKVLSRFMVFGPGCPVLRTYASDAAGYLDTVQAGANLLDFTFDSSGQLSNVDRGSNHLTNSYDGRGFLKTSSESASLGYVNATYSSQGLLYSLERQPTGGSKIERNHFLYFAGRPVAIWKKLGSSAAVTIYLTTDHLGAPIFALNQAGTEYWKGGLEPFGRDWQEGTANDMLTKGIFLRFPGQWDDTLFSNPTLGADIFYNVHRWYEQQTGRYASADPLGMAASTNAYAYVDGRATSLVDPLGLLGFDSLGCQSQSKGANAARGDLGCCVPKLEEAVRQYNRFFLPGWRVRNPDCWKALAGLSASRKPIGDMGKGGLSPLTCMSTGHRGETVGCNFKMTDDPHDADCGQTDPATGATSFGQDACEQGACAPPLVTLFHERMHRCGAPDDSPYGGAGRNEARTIARTCVGF